MTIENWNGYTFEVSSQLIRGFSGLTIKGSCETKEKTSGKQKYVTRNAADPAEISLTVQLNALTGVTDVRSEAIDLVKASGDGTSAYFYIGDSKLVPCKVMLVSATVDNVKMVGTKWVCCDVKMSMKQSSNEGGSTSSGKHKKSKKKSVKKSNGKISAWDVLKKEAELFAGGVVKAAKSVSKAEKSVWTGIKTEATKAVVKKPAQKTTSAKKIATTGRVASGGGKKKVASKR